MKKEETAGWISIWSDLVSLSGAHKLITLLLLLTLRFFPLFLSLLRSSFTLESDGIAAFSSGEFSGTPKEGIEPATLQINPLATIYGNQSEKSTMLKLAVS